MTREQLAELRSIATENGDALYVRVTPGALLALLDMASRCVSVETVRLLEDYVARPTGKMGLNRFGRFSNAAYRELRGEAESRAREGR